jgi:hypothetical protein
MRCALELVLVLGVLASACVSPDATDDDVDGETSPSETSPGETDDGEGEADGTESLLGETCSPVLGDCSPTMLCCSTDPSALDLDDLAAIVLPSYSGFGIDGGLPLFADANNGASRRGICVLEDSVPEDADLAGAPGCFKPCNPLWSDSEITEVCGPNSGCCQDVDLDVSDCVFDPSLGDAGCWRAVTGFDIVGLGGLDATEWGATEHASHQDPGLAPDGACETVISGLPPELDVAIFRVACQQRLTVANQRGACLPGGSQCPYEAPGYIDACEQLNLTAGLTGC